MTEPMPSGATPIGFVTSAREGLRGVRFRFLHEASIQRLVFAKGTNDQLSILAGVAGAGGVPLVHGNGPVPVGLYDADHAQAILASATRVGTGSTRDLVLRPYSKSYHEWEALGVLWVLTKASSRVAEVAELSAEELAGINL